MNWATSSVDLPMRSINVRGRPAANGVVVTQLVTHTAALAMEVTHATRELTSSELRKPRPAFDCPPTASAALSI